MFFNTPEQIKEHVDVNASFKLELLIPKLKQLDRDILKLYFGDEFIDDLQADYDTTTDGDISPLPAPKRIAITKMREISGPLAMALWITPGQVQVDNAGIFIARNENRATAFGWQIDDLIKSYIKVGYQAIEDSINTLSRGIINYPLYAAYDEYIYFKRSFIPDSRHFTRLYSPLKNCYKGYITLRSCMDKVDEQDIKNLLLPTLYTAIKTRLAAGTLTAYDDAILPLIKRAIANLTVYRAISELSLNFDDDGFVELDNTSGAKQGKANKTAKGETVIRASNSLSDSANSYMSDLRKYLEANKTNYPEYTSDPEYVADLPAQVINADDQNFYNAH